MPRLQLARWLGALFVTTVVGGLAGTFFPYFSYTSPVSALIPAGLRNSDYVANLVRPAVAQVQDVLGYDAPRPMAPFEYTNAWGNNYSLLLIWFIVGWWICGKRVHRVIAVPVLVVSIIPVVYSLNRGLWIGLGISAAYVAFRLAWRGRLSALVYLSVGTLVIVGGVVTSPFGAIISGRLSNPHSNEIRASLSHSAIQGALESPVIGWGSTRAQVGSGRSIAIGRSADCPLCGNRVIGSTGQLWLALFAHGIIGALFYCGFFLFACWHYRHDHSIIGLAGGLGAALPLFYMTVYSALTSPLMIYLLSVALLWRNERLRQGADSVPTR